LRLEDLKNDSWLNGIVTGESVQIISHRWIGSESVSVIYKHANANLGERMLFRSNEVELSETRQGRPWALDADAGDFRLSAEAFRIRLAHLFDPLMAVHTSSVEPLPHQITAVYETMLPRQPLRFVLADDPGAGKTIMAGLLIKELMMRGDLERCIVIAPGGLVEQWQDEMDFKFGLSFRIFSRQEIEFSRSGNPFEENPLWIARMDQLARAEDLQAKLEDTDWDLVVVDEAHKLSANWFGNKLNKTKRYQFGEFIGRRARNFLLMTATPHNGKEEDFQTFLGLLDSDRFYGKFRSGVHQVDIGDLVRRMTKEELLKFDGTPLFPERRAYSVNYELSQEEASLYTSVTDYVNEEMDRAKRLEGKRKGTVGFALTILQRRLASSPEAIHRSLERRLRRLENMLNEARLVERSWEYEEVQEFSEEEVDELYEESSSEELEELEEEVVSRATAARTIEELQAEIVILQGLVQESMHLRHSGVDRKWQELSKILQDEPEMRDRHGNPRKMIIFTEHRDTLNYLLERISNLIGTPEKIVTIHGSTKREDRRRNQALFTSDRDIQFLLATDAAGEGINLQRANLMVNYDLPWNPNRIEQRFGRIHRIGQTEVCHLWNLVAFETREGSVFQRLFEKLETQRDRLGGKVFDILGQVFEQQSLKQLLLEAIRYGDQPEIQARLNQVVDDALDVEHLKRILERNALASEAMTSAKVFRIREEMEEAEARKLQPFFIQSFFEEAFSHFGGQLRAREPRRFEATHVPGVIRNRDARLGGNVPVLRRYERICFDKDHVLSEGKPPAILINPAHPLMQSTLDLVLEKHRGILKQGTVLIDRADEGTEPRMLFMMTHSIREGAQREGESNKSASQQMHFVSVNPSGTVQLGGHAPYLDCDLPKPGELELVQPLLSEEWLQAGLEDMALEHVVSNLVPGHLEEVQDRRTRWVSSARTAVQDRLVKEINYWTHRYEQLKLDVDSGRQPRMRPDNAKRRATELSDRLEIRLQELDRQLHLISQTPVVVGGSLIVPQGLLDQRSGKEVPQWASDAEARSRIEQAAMRAVMEHERSLGYEPVDVSAQKYGWDITSRMGNGEVRFLEVKGRVQGSRTVTLTKNEILAALNQPERWFLSIVMVEEDQVDGPHYIQHPITQEPDFAVTSVNLNLTKLLEGRMD